MWKHVVYQPETPTMGCYMKEEIELYCILVLFVTAASVMLTNTFSHI